MEFNFYKPGLSKNETLAQQLKEFQDDPTSLVFVQLAENYRKQGLARQALEICNEGLDFHAGLPSALVVRAHCFFDLQKFADCLQELNNILQKNPENIKALKLRAQVFLHLGQKQAAKQALEKVLQFTPKDLESNRAVIAIENTDLQKNIPVQNITIVSSDHFPGNIREFQVEDLPALSIEVNEPAEVEELTFATRTIAELYLRQGFKEKAIKTIKKILEQNPDDQWAQNTLKAATGQNIKLVELEKKAQILKNLLQQVRSNFSKA